MSFRESFHRAGGRFVTQVARRSESAYPVGVFGFFNIHKPPGPTSHDMVAGVRRMLPRRTKTGHAGTLDPFAEGVLVICVGPATRLADYVQRQPKRYLAEVTLGATSTTDDPTGDITPVAEAAPPDADAVKAAAVRFVGRIEQIPPAHSAVHVNGERAYHLARSGRDVSLPARPVTIHSIDVVSYDYPQVTLDVACGSGTYIRALARDLGEALDVGGYCSKLSRTAVGEFTLERARSLEELDVQRDLLSPMLALEALPRITVNAAQSHRVMVGNSVPLPTGVEGEEIAVLNETGDLLAIARADITNGLLQPTKVFAARA